MTAGQIGSEVPFNMNQSKLIWGHRAFFAAIIAWYGFLGLGAMIWNQGGLTGTDKSQLLEIGIIGLIPLAGLILTFLGSPETYFRRITPIARYFAAYVFVKYGFSKLEGGQFYILDSELDKPMGSVSPLWLTWYFFSYSEIYGGIIAGVQIIGGILLVFQRTALLGACLLVPVAGNIILIDIFYGIHGPIPIILMLAAALFIVISERAPELIDLFWNNRSTVRVKWGGWVGRSIFFLFLVLNLGALAALKLHPPGTPLDGTWTMAEVHPNEVAAQVPPTIFFEKNRHFCVFKDRTGAYKKNEFEVDPKTQTISIWSLTGWDMDGSKTRGDKIFEGTYMLMGNVLQLRGAYGNDQATLLLVKKAPLIPGS